MIELFTSDFVPLGEIANALRVGYTHKLNDIPTGELVLAAQDPVNEQIIVPSSWARIYDGETDAGLYRISGITDEEHTDAGTITYAMEGARSTLLDDMLIGHHELGGEELDTRWVLEYILARQTVTRWVLGDVDFTAYYQYNFEDVTLLEAIMSLGEVLTEDYEFVFDASGAPPWTLHLKRLSSDAACALCYGRTMGAIKRTVDGRIVTRLVGRGYGEGDNQLTIASVNGGKDYLDADTMDTWGVRVGLHADRRQTDPVTLKARMAAILEGGKRPRVSYSATALDLYRATGERWDHHLCGDMVLVLDGVSGETSKTRITKRSKKDVDGDPGAVELTLDTSIRDVADELNEVLDKIGVQELYSQGATNMYSLQTADSGDPDHPVKMTFYIPGNVLRINSCLLKWQIDRFRSYSRMAKAGGGTVKTTAEDGGATVTTPSVTVSIGDLASGGVRDEDGGANPATGLPKTLSGGSKSNTDSGGTHRHNFTHTHILAKHSHGLDGGSHRHHIAYHKHGLGTSYTTDVQLDTDYRTPDFTVEDTGPLWTSSPYGSVNGSSASATGDAGSHSHGMEHVHNMPHVHTIGHEHIIPSVTLEIEPHTHSVSLPSHTHELEYGIYEGSRAQGVQIKVDGEFVPEGEVGEDREMDIAAYLRKNSDGKVTRKAWHTVEFVPDDLTRIVANLFLQVFIQSRGAGDY